MKKNQQDKPTLDKKKNVRIRNRTDIDNYITYLLKNALKLIDILFIKLLQAILAELDEMYRRYKSKDNNITWTEVNKYNRMNKMMNRIEGMASDHFKEVVRIIKKSQENVYIEEHNASLFIHEKEVQKEIVFDVPSPKEIQKAIEQPLNKLKVKETMKKHEKDLKDKIRLIITQGLMNGDGYSEVANEIEKQTEMSKKRAQRVARTETHRAQSQAKLDSGMQLKANGLSPKKKWHSTLDTRTRDTHRHLDGETKDIDEPFESSGCKGQAPGLFIGVTSAKENINCRCSMLVFLNKEDLPKERRARGDDGKTYIVNDMTYRDWEKMKRKGG